MEEKENVLKKLLKKEVIISLVVGLLLGAGIMYFANGGGIVGRVSGTLLTKGKLYNKMKNYYSIGLMLEDVDSAILDKKYPLSEEEKDDIKKTADGYIAQYSQYGYTQEQFLEENGFEDYDNFLEYLQLDYKRTLYYYDYLENKLDENAVQNYYDENAFGKVNTKHILAKISDTMTEEQALKVTNEIISRLNAGEDFDALAEEYTTNDSTNIITEDLGEIGAFDSIESTYVDAMKELEVGGYTLTPVKTSYGYHVIYCVDKEEKTSEISANDRMAIIDVLAADIEAQDSNLYYKALIQMRDDAKLKFFDSNLKAKYKEYCDEYLKTTEEDA